MIPGSMALFISFRGPIIRRYLRPGIVSICMGAYEIVPEGVSSPMRRDFPWTTCFENGVFSPEVRWKTIRSHATRTSPQDGSVVFLHFPALGAIPPRHRYSEILVGYPPLQPLTHSPCGARPTCRREAPSETPIPHDSKCMLTI